MNPRTALVPRERAALLYRAATLVVQLLPLAKALESDAFASAERARFRELAGQSSVYELMDALRPLCSDDAHAINRANHTTITLAVVDARTGNIVLKSYPRAQPGPEDRRES